MSMRWTALVACGLLLAGCFMNLQDLRATPPVRTAVISNDDHARLGDCVGEALILKGSMPYQIVSRPDVGRTSVTGYIQAGYPPPGLDLLFIQRDRDVLVEARYARQHSGPFTDDVIAAGLDREAWPALQRCAGRPGPVTKP
jgi:hypothetical protein